MKSLRKLHTGKPYVQFERRTKANVRATLRASSDPSVKCKVPLKTCTVVIHDLNQTVHAIDVTAETLYDAVAQALPVRRSDQDAYLPALTASTPFKIRHLRKWHCSWLRHKKVPYVAKTKAAVALVIAVERAINDGEFGLID